MKVNSIARMIATALAGFGRGTTLMEPAPARRAKPQNRDEQALAAAEAKRQRRQAKRRSLQP